jgi:shikimate kinase
VNQELKPRVVLVGPMGAGKSTVARILGRRWELPTRDTDVDVEKVAGKTVQDIFVDDGEAAFRALEAAAVATALAEHEGVLSLGGGAVLDPVTRERLDGHTVVFLKVGLAAAVRRVGLAESRPVLNQAVGGVRTRIKSLLDERAPLYASVATLTVDTDGRTPDDVAAEILAALDAS